MEYNIGGYAAAALRKLWGKIHRAPNNDPGHKAGEGNGNFLNELLAGLHKFDGKVLFLMGDRFLLSDEFDVLMASSPQWRSAYGKATHERIDIEGGDQVFSTKAAQERLFDAASEWIHCAFPERLLMKSRPNGRQARQSAGGQALA